MDLEFDARYDEFRKQIRDFVATHEPPRSFGLIEDKKDELAQG